MTWSDGGWMWLWGSLSMLAVVAGVWLVVGAARGPGPRRGDRARDILAERYARGDLSTDEYRERLDAID